MELSLFQLETPVIPFICAFMFVLVFKLLLGISRCVWFSWSTYFDSPIDPISLYYSVLFQDVLLSKIGSLLCHFEIDVHHQFIHNNYHLWIIFNVLIWVWVLICIRLWNLYNYHSSSSSIFTYLIWLFHFCIVG